MAFLSENELKEIDLKETLERDVLDSIKAGSKLVAENEE
jgi:hypothetical protein